MVSGRGEAGDCPGEGVGLDGGIAKSGQKRRLSAFHSERDLPLRWLLGGFLNRSFGRQLGQCWYKLRLARQWSVTSAMDRTLPRHSGSAEQVT